VPHPIKKSDPTGPYAMTVSYRTEETSLEFITQLLIYSSELICPVELT